MGAKESKPCEPGVYHSAKTSLCSGRGDCKEIICVGCGSSLNKRMYCLTCKIIEQKRIDSKGKRPQSHVLVPLESMCRTGSITRDEEGNVNGDWDELIASMMLSKRVKYKIPK